MRVIGSTGPVAQVAALALVVLGACAPTVPDSGAGFDSYGSWEQGRIQRDAELTGTDAIQPPERTTSGGALETIPAEDLAAAGIGTARGAAAPAGRNNPGISDENDFQAVSGRETIQSDAARIAANRAAYTQVEPTALPTRSGAGGPNIVAFALSTSNSVGQSLYRRGGLNVIPRFNRNCAKYASSDLAQEDFLRRGGPERDRLGIDPDGDGFACFWDPAPFRTARVAPGTPLEGASGAATGLADNSDATAFQ